jgi:hypothetical protein
MPGAAETPVDAAARDDHPERVGVSRRWPFITCAGRWGRGWNRHPFRVMLIFTFDAQGDRLET